MIVYRGPRLIEVLLSFQFSKDSWESRRCQGIASRQANDWNR